MQRRPLSKLVPVFIAARMLLVMSFLVLMPCWAVLWVPQSSSDGQRQDVAKVVTLSQVDLSRTDPLPDAPAGRPQPQDRVAGRHNAADDSPARPDSTGVDRNAPRSITAQALPPDMMAAIRRLEDRLKELGADYMVLGYHAESGDLPGNYRFLCRMPLPDNAAYARPFEAIDDDPLGAMQRVLRDVESWRSSTPSAEVPVVVGRPGGEADRY